MWMRASATLSSGSCRRPGRSHCHHSEDRPAGEGESSGWHRRRWSFGIRDREGFAGVGEWRGDTSRRGRGVRVGGERTLTVGGAGGCGHSRGADTHGVASRDTHGESGAGAWSGELGAEIGDPEGWEGMERRVGYPQRSGHPGWDRDGPPTDWDTPGIGSIGHRIGTGIDWDTHGFETPTLGRGENEAGGLRSMVRSIEGRSMGHPQGWDRCRADRDTYARSGNHRGNQARQSDTHGRTHLRGVEADLPGLRQRGCARGAAGFRREAVGTEVSEHHGELALQLGAGHAVLRLSGRDRRIMYTTDAIESLNGTVRKAVRVHVPNDGRRPS
jgi:hypothetical protein